MSFYLYMKQERASPSFGSAVGYGESLVLLEATEKAAAVTEAVGKLADPDTQYRLSNAYLLELSQDLTSDMTSARDARVLAAKEAAYNKLKSELGK